MPGHVFLFFFFSFETNVVLEVILKDPTKKLLSQVSLVKFAPCALPQARKLTYELEHWSA